MTAPAASPNITPSRAKPAHPRWMSRWLFAAGCYNIVYGLWVMAFPHHWFDMAGMERLNHPEIWQCLGMVLGCYGVAYLLAARDPIGQWPIVFVGLLGKVLGPIGMVGAVATGKIPLVATWMNVTNDLVWWVPFGMILMAARRARLAEKP
jgi:small multidrug resistance pump